MVDHNNIATLPKKHRLVEIQRRVQDPTFFDTLVKKQQWKLVGEAFDVIGIGKDTLEDLQSGNIQRCTYVALQHRSMDLFRYLAFCHGFGILDCCDPMLDTLCSLLEDPQIASLYCEQLLKSTSNPWYSVENMLKSMTIESALRLLSFVARSESKIDLCTDVVCRILQCSTDEHKDVVRSILEIPEKMPVDRFLSYLRDMSNVSVDDSLKIFQLGELFSLWL